METLRLRLFLRSLMMLLLIMIMNVTEESAGYFNGNPMFHVVQCLDSDPYDCKIDLGAAEPISHALRRQFSTKSQHGRRVEGRPVEGRADGNLSNVRGLGRRDHLL